MQQIVLHNRVQFDQIASCRLYAPELQRVSAAAGSIPRDLRYVDVTLGSSSEHLVVHDVHELGWWSFVAGGQMYDVTVYHCGWQSTAENDSRARSNEGHGYALYMQNAPGSPQKVIDTCAFIAGFSPQVVKIFSTQTDTITHFLIQRSIFVGKSLLIGGVQHPADDIIIEDCTFLDSGIDAGYVASNGSLTLRRNIITGTLTVGSQNANNRLGFSWGQVVCTENTFILHPQPADGDPAPLVTLPSVWFVLEQQGDRFEEIKLWDWDYNTYYSPIENPFVVWMPARAEDGSFRFDEQNRPVGGYARLTFERWQEITGFDAHSTFIQTDVPEPLIKVYPITGMNAAQVAAINPAGLDTLPLPDGFGEATIRDLRNFDAPYQGEALMMAGEVSAPLNWTGSATEAPLWRATFPRYGAFRVERG